MSAATQTLACIKDGANVIINFGLAGPLSGRNKLTVDQRLINFDKLLPEVLQAGYRREVLFSVDPYDEPTFIVSGKFRLDASYSLRLWEALVENEQDCCSIYYPQLDAGVLFGPNAVEWGEFDKLLFKFPLAQQDDYPTLN